MPAVPDPGAGTDLRGRLRRCSSPRADGDNRPPVANDAAITEAHSASRLTLASHDLTPERHNLVRFVHCGTTHLGQDRLEISRTGAVMADVVRV